MGTVIKIPPEKKNKRVSTDSIDKGWGRWGSLSGEFRGGPGRVGGQSSGTRLEQIGP